MSVPLSTRRRPGDVVHLLVGMHLHELLAHPELLRQWVWDELRADAAGREWEEHEHGTTYGNAQVLLAAAELLMLLHLLDRLEAGERSARYVMGRARRLSGQRDTCKGCAR